MGHSFIRPAAVSLLLTALCGCASQSELASIRLDRDHPKFKTRGCQDALAAAETHKEIKNTRMVVSPVLLFFSGGLLLPVVAANAGLDTADQVDAAKIAENCGGKPKTNDQIASDVAVGAAVGVATSTLTVKSLTAK
jgi:hypothetical protein